MARHTFWNPLCRLLTDLSSALAVVAVSLRGANTMVGETRARRSVTPDAASEANYVAVEPPDANGEARATIKSSMSIGFTKCSANPDASLRCRSCG